MTCRGRGVRTTHAQILDVEQTAEMDTPAVLERYILRDAYETAREIGRGSYATVVELDY